MNRDLVTLLEAYDAYMQARGKPAIVLLAIYDSRLEDFVSLNPSLNQETLRRMVRFAYPRWLKSQNKPAGIPPKA